MSVYTGKKIDGPKCPKCGMAKHTPDALCNTRKDGGRGK